MARGTRQEETARRARARELVETTPLSLRAIGAMVGMNPESVARAARREGWARQGGGEGRRRRRTDAAELPASFRERLRLAADTLLSDLEARLAAPDADEPSRARDLRTLTAVVRIWRSLGDEAEPRPGPSRVPDRNPEDPDGPDAGEDTSDDAARREELARRLVEFLQERDPAGGDG